MSERLTYRGGTTVYGRCIRVGGEAKRTAMIHVTGSRRGFHPITVRLASKSLAQELGRRLYETVGLEGEATWDAETNDLIAFRATALSQYRDRDPGMDRPRTNIETLQALAEASGGRWDDVDPDEFVRELRRD